MDFHPRGTVLATASDDHSVRVWDLRKRRRSTELGEGDEGFIDFRPLFCEGIGVSIHMLFNSESW